jgi:hypothetical protein
MAMRKPLMSGLALALLLPVAGCGDNPNKVASDRIDLVNRLADVLEGVTDRKSAEEARSEVKAVQKQLEALDERARRLKLSELPRDKEGSLKSKFKGDMKQAADRLKKAQDRVLGNPETAGVLQPLNRDRLAAQIRYFTG